MDEKRRILIIEDDEDLAAITDDMLSDYGFEVTAVTNGEAAYEYLQNHSVHLILLDINLPDEDGFSICKEIRSLSTVPILFASARTSEDDRITSLDIGGDDYLAKPYSLKEMLSHINALLRRTYGFGKEKSVVKTGELSIDLGARKVSVGQKTLSLSLKEFDVLAYLAKHIGEAVKKEELLSEVWGMYNEVELTTVAVHIRWLREKIEEDPSKPQYIQTVWGVGYRLAKEEK